jgi:hypothetical protein
VLWDLWWKFQFRRLARTSSAFRAFMVNVNKLGFAEDCTIKPLTVVAAIAANGTG